MKYVPVSLIMLLFAAVVFIDPSDARAGETALTTGQNQQFEGSLIFSATPLKSMTNIPFELRLADNEGNKPVVRSAVCDLTMPAMAMPANQPDLNCSGSICTGTAIFTMAGAWQATFNLIMKDGTHASISFDINMVKMK